MGDCALPPPQAKPATKAKPPEPNKRSALPPLAAAIAALMIVTAGGAWWFLGANRIAPLAANAPPRESIELRALVFFPPAS